jgi:hypothetical protein
VKRAQLEQIAGGPLTSWQLVWCRSRDPRPVRRSLPGRPDRVLTHEFWISRGYACPACKAAR